MSTTLLDQARATPGIAQASALIMAGTSIAKPGGGNLAITVVGVDTDTMLGGPFNVVAGDPLALRQADTIFLEDSQREKYGAVNVGSTRELNGQRIRVGGFTWGLVPFGPPYAFADIDLAREVTDVAVDRMNFVLVRVQPGMRPEDIRDAISPRVPEALVLTRDEYHTSIVTTLLKEQLGMSFGISTSFGLIIGLVIVSLSMFSSVLDNLREFGTLKAIGCTNGDLSILLLVQSMLYALIGSVVGLGWVTNVVEGIRNPLLVPIIPHYVIYAAPLVMVVLCLFASTLALMRIRRLEPGMVFR
jgi:putative ABC transport system permease protein